MPFGDLFKNKKLRTPPEVVQKFVSAVGKLHSTEAKELAKANEDVVKYMVQLKSHLFGTDEYETSEENAVAIASSGCQMDLLAILVNELESFEFETRKDAAQVSVQTISGPPPKRGDLRLQRIYDCTPPLRVTNTIFLS